MADRNPYPTDVSDEEWAFVAPYLIHAHELFGYEDAQKILENLAESAPKLVEDLVPKTVPLGLVVKVLQNLLQERVPIRDMRSIAETLAEYGVKSQDPDILTSAVRSSFGRLIIHEISGIQNQLPVITLDYELEQLLLIVSSDGERK